MIWGIDRKDVYDHVKLATVAEIEFLRGLGHHLERQGQHEHRKGDPGDRLALLKSYLSSMSHRKEWGAIRPDKVRKACVEMIAEEMAKAPPPKPFIPLNGHGLFGSRQYARFARSRSGDTE